jgi:hypothetical protein
MSETETTEPTKPAGCANCAWPDIERFCPHCGQENVPSALPIREIVLGFLEEFLKFDTKLWITLKALVTKPGFLTSEYLVGRRVRYVAPIRLYIALGFLAFFVFALFPDGKNDAGDRGELSGFSTGYSLASGLVPVAERDEKAKPKATDASPMSDEDEEEKAPNRDTSAKAKHDDACSDVAQTVAEKELARRNELRRDAWLSGNRSTLNLLRIPLYALLLAYLLRKETKRLYIEHLIFTLHYLSFEQITDIAGFVFGHLPLLGGLIGFALTLTKIGYFVLAAKSVYELPVKRKLIWLMLAFLVLGGLVTVLTGFTAGIVYRITG